MVGASFFNLLAVAKNAVEFSLGLELVLWMEHLHFHKRVDQVSRVDKKLLIAGKGQRICQEHGEEVGEKDCNF